MHVKGFKHTGRGPIYGAHTAPTGKAIGKPVCFAEGGAVDGALVKRSKPITDEDRAGGGRTPLRSGFKKGGAAKKGNPFAKKAGALSALKSMTHKAEGGRVGNVAAALKAVQSMVNRGIPAEKAAALAASQHRIDRSAITSEMAKKGVTPDPALLAKGGPARRSYGAFNRTPRIQS